MSRSLVRFRPEAPEDVEWLFGVDIGEDDYPIIPVDGSHDKMSQAGGWGNRGRTKSEEHKRKISKTLTGHTHSVETKNKIGKSASKTNRKRVWTDEMRANLSVAMAKSHAARR